MPSRLRPAGLLLALVLVVPVSASGPVFWTVASSTEFLQGRSDGVYLGLDGIISAGPRLTNRLTSSPAQIWSLAQAADGTLWAGTGGDGRLLRLRPNQPEEVVYDAPETNIFAVALDGTRVFAASSPDGRVMRIDASGAAQPFFDPEEKYIWAMSVDGQGRLWVGVGNPAAIYRVDASGTSTLVYKPAADHVVAIAPDSQGRMLAGTESPGRLYRFDAADRPFVLLDSGLTELRAISATADGTVFAAAVARGDASPSAGESTSVAVTTASAASSAGGASSSSTSSSTPVERRSAVYRIDVSGTWETIWETPDVVYDLAASADGSLLVATGPSGRLYRIGPTREVSLHTGVDAKQITRFAAPSPTGPGALATANPGRAIAIGGGTQSPATYLSSVRDTGSVATWGQLRWESSGAVQLFTRSGNTAEPDDSWSPWSTAYARTSGDDITSPPARFLQWKAELTSTASAEPRLRSVTVAYLPRNSRPSVASITVHPPGVVFQRPFANEDGAIAGLDDLTADSRRPPGDAGPTPPAPGRRMFQKGLQTIAWKAEDADGDRLRYTLQYRRDGDTDWQTLRTDLGDTIFVWDTTAMADGRYAVKVVASDLASNAADRALSGERTSGSIVIDNTPPTITTEIVRGAPGPRMVVRVQDALSPIQKLEYSLAGAAWQLVYPADGLADSPDERYEIPLASEGDAARIVVRATDLLQNVTSRAGGSR